jgi:hypothetical protein
VTAVAAWRATAEERDHALPAYEACFIVHGLERSAASETLIALFNLANGMEALRANPPSRHALIARIRSALERGLLLIVTGGPFYDSGAARPGQIDRDLGPDDQIAESLMGDRRDLVFQTHRYRVISVRRWRERQRQSLSSGDFRPLPAREARAVIGRLWESSQTSSSGKASWKQALERLFDNGSAAGRAGEEGVMLLRYMPPGGSFAEEAATPAPPSSRPRSPVASTDWIELEIIYEDGASFDADLTLELPDGRVTTGPADHDGRIRVDEILPGPCLVSLTQSKASQSSSRS